MGTVVSTRERSVYGLLVGLGARARGLERSLLAPEIAHAVAAHFGALLLTLHGSADGWAEAVSDPLGALARLKTLARARVETIDARLASLAVERNTCVSALDLDEELSAESFLAQVLGSSDTFAVPLRAAGGPAGALVVYLVPSSQPPGEADLLALAGLGDVLALAAGPAATHAPAGPAASRVPAALDPAPPAGGFLRRLFGR